MQQVIATHKIRYNGQWATIRLYSPVRVPNGGYACSFDTTSMPPPRRRISAGMDSMQALLRALAEIVCHLAELGVYPTDEAGKQLSPSFPIILAETEFLSSMDNLKLRDALRARHSAKVTAKHAETSKGK